MKKIKNLSTPRLVSTLMALLLFFTAFASFGVVKADATNEPTTYNSGYTGDIYYFYDLYPTLRPTDIQTHFSSNNVNYERNHVNEQQFAAMVDQSYFTSVSSETVVVIDIKTFKPSTTVMQQLFSELKEDGRVTCFVCTYPESLFITGAIPNVDFYFETDLNRLENFMDYVFRNVDDREISIASNLTILLDNNLIDVNTYDGEPLYAMGLASPYLRLILKHLAGISDDSTPQEYANAAERLTGDGIQLLVYTENGFVDILTWQVASPDNIDNGFAVGFWRLEDSFYNCLYGVKQVYPNFPIYIFEAELIEYSDNGLPIISESALEELYGECENESDEFLTAFKNFLDSLN